MSNYSNARSGRIYAKVQGSFGAAATLAGANCCRHSKISLKAENPRAQRRDKTGTLSQTPGIGGLRMASVAVEMDLAANGAAGVVPDSDPFLQSLFGAAPTVSAGTSVVYNQTDSLVPITIAHYRAPSTVQQQLAWGCVITQAEWGFNDGVIAGVKFSGSGAYVPDSIIFSTLDAGGKGGLGSFPAEPGSPVTNGGVATAFRGSLTLNGNAALSVKSGRLRLSRPATAQRGFGTGYPTGWGLGGRSVSLSFDLFDDDSAEMTDMLQHGIGDAAFGATLVIGNVAGNIHTFTLSGLQIASPSLDDSSGDRWVASFGDATASVATLGLTNELIYTIT